MNQDEEYISDNFEGDEDYDQDHNKNNAAVAIATHGIHNDLVDKEVEQVIKKNEEHNSKPTSGYVLPGDDDDEDDEGVAQLRGVL